MKPIKQSSSFEIFKNLLNRHQARQAEPKDYDINKDGARTMTLSTYNRIGNVTDGVKNK